jgi:hypothetical protein
MAAIRKLLELGKVWYNTVKWCGIKNNMSYILSIPQYIAPTGKRIAI